MRAGGGVVAGQGGRVGGAACSDMGLVLGKGHGVVGVWVHQLAVAVA